MHSLYVWNVCYTLVRRSTPVSCVNIPNQAGRTKMEIAEGSHPRETTSGHLAFLHVV